MAYIAPSVLVYQQLSSAAGTTTSTPDLPACIVGPAYNVIAYDPTSATSLLNSSATSAVTGTGSMALGSTSLVLTNPAAFEVGDTLYVVGAGSAGVTLTTVVMAVNGLTLTVGTAALTAVTNAPITKAAVIVDPSITNPFNLPNQRVGQDVDLTSIGVYLNNAVTRTLETVFSGQAGTTELDVFYPSVTGTMAASATIVTAVVGTAGLAVGDTVSVAGAGASGAALVATVSAVSVVNDTITLSAPATTAVTAAVITKQAVPNVNSATSTLNVQPGAVLTLNYTNTSGVAKTFTTTAASVTNITSPLTSVFTVDQLPADFSASTTVPTATAAATTVTPASVVGFAAGQTVILRGAGAGGSDLTTTIVSIATGVVTLANAVVTSVTNAAFVNLGTALVYVKQTFNNQLLSMTNADSTVNYDTSDVITEGIINIHPYPRIAYGTVLSASVNIAYRALRTDLSGAMLNIAGETDAQGQLGDLTDANPLGLGVSLALQGANSSTGGVNAFAVPSNDSTGFVTALEALENQSVYALALLTQDMSIIDAVQAHVDQMSTPENAAWRIAFVNTAIPTSQNVGPWSSTLVNANNGNNSITLVNGDYILTASNATFSSDGVVPGDTIVVTAGSGTPSPVGNLTVLEVLSNQQVQVAATGIATAVSYYVSRTLSKAQKATAVAAVSSSLADRRMYHVQPDTVGVSINGVTKMVPGYYAACVLAGMVSGYVPQQGFTNMTVPGIETLANSNFYFTKAQLNTMAAAGTLLLIQDSQTSSPYVRHQLSTQLDTINDKELSRVKNIDYLSYFYQNQLKGFIGKYNITTESLQTLSVSINAGSGFLIGQTVDKIGAPLLSATITSLAQSTTNVDQVICTLSVSIGTPMNNILLYLVV
jgi:hypothetical protein